MILVQLMTNLFKQVNDQLSSYVRKDENKLRRSLAEKQELLDEMEVLEQDLEVSEKEKESKSIENRRLLTQLEIMEHTMEDLKKSHHTSLEEQRDDYLKREAEKLVLERTNNSLSIKIKELELDFQELCQSHTEKIAEFVQEKQNADRNYQALKDEQQKVRYFASQIKQTSDTKNMHSL